MHEPNVPRPTVSSSSIQVRQLDRDNVVRWDAFIEQCSEATFFHRAGWKRVIDDAFGHATYYLYAESGGHVEGVLPLGHIRSRLFGNSLVSTPFCVYGGIVATTETAQLALQSAAADLARRLKVDYLELRNEKPCNLDWQRKDLYVTFRKAIDPDPEKNFLAIPRKQRRMVRQGLKAGLATEVDNDVQRFYEIYAISLRNLGTPVLSKKYFHILKEIFRTHCEVLTVTTNGKPIASVMSFYFRDTVLPYYGGSLPEGRRVAANDFMYWELMRRACERGYRIFDYGRSKKGTGSYRFKEHWGFVPEPLHYEYLPVNIQSVPDINPLNPKYRLLVRVWQHMPITLTKLIGPILAKDLA
jgi:FemAB-related protein (PEP-CTERM system-associated)